MNPDSSRPTSRVPRPSKDRPSDDEIIDKMMPVDPSAADRALSAELAASQKALAEVRAELAAAKHELDFTRQAMRTATKRVPRSEPPPVTSRLQVTAPDRDVAKLRDALKAAEQEVRDLREKVGKWEDDYATLRLDLDTLQADHEEVRHASEAAIEDAKRFKAERETAIAERDAARAEAQHQAELASAARAQAQRPQTPRLTKAGLPIIVFVEPKQYAAGLHKTPDDLHRLFPTPHLARYYVALGDLVADVLSGRLSLDELQVALSTLRQSELDAHFDPKLPLNKLLPMVNEAGRVWFGKIGMHMSEENRKLVDIHGKLGTTRTERDQGKATLDAFSRSLIDERTTNQQIVTMLEAKLQAVQDLLAEIVASPVLGEWIS